MAGDWIKMRSNLDTDPDVIAIAAQLGIDEFAVVGRLHKFWSWADQHSLAGILPRLTPAWIDRFVACQGFSDALQCVGWLAVQQDSIILPAWERHNGSPAKSRAGEAVRKQLQRHSQKEDAQKCPDNYPDICPDSCPPSKCDSDLKIRCQEKADTKKSLLDGNATGAQAEKQVNIDNCPEQCPDMSPDNRLDQRRVEKRIIPTYLPSKHFVVDDEWIETIRHHFPDRDVDGELKVFQDHCLRKGSIANRQGFVGWLKKSSPVIRQEVQLRYSY